MKRILFSALLLCLTACGYKGVGGSFVGPLPTDSAITAIASDASAFLSDRYPPGHTSLYLYTPEEEARNAFSATLENILRRSGFMIVQSPGSSSISVAYTLDRIGTDENAAWYLQLRLSDGESVARSYGPSGIAEAGRSFTPLQPGMLKKASNKAAQAYNTL